MASILKKYSNDELMHIAAFFPRVQDDLITSNITANASRIAAKYDTSKEKQLNIIITKLFKLSSYEGLKNISGLNLLTQFIERKNILTELKKTNKLAQYSIVKLISDPLFGHSKSRFMISNYSETINDITLSELYFISDTYYKSGDFRNIKNLHKMLENGYGNADPSLLDTPITKRLGNKVITSINLDISDEILEEQFLAYLKRKRRELDIQPKSTITNVKKKLTPALISSIRENRVIPYLDLLILDHYVNNEKTLTPKKLGKLLFSETHDLESAKEKIKKTTSKLANNMLSTDRLNEMLAELGKSYGGIFDYDEPPDRL